MIGIAGGGLEFSGQADRTRFVGAKEIQGEAAQEGEILGGIAQADYAGIFTEGDIKASV